MEWDSVPEVSGLSMFHFDIGAPEEINLGTGKKSFYFPEVPL